GVAGGGSEPRLPAAAPRGLAGGAARARDTDDEQGQSAGGGADEPGPHGRLLRGNPFPRVNGPAPDSLPRPTRRTPASPAGPRRRPLPWRRRSRSPPGSRSPAHQARSRAAPIAR